MKRIPFLFSLLLILTFAGVAFAHPLGNFSINQYSRLEVGKSEIRIRQVLDMAEIPTFQETNSIDADKDGTLSKDELSSYAAKLTPNYLASLRLMVNGNPVQVRAASQNIQLVPGAGNLNALRIENVVGVELLERCLLEKVDCGILEHVACEVITDLTHDLVAEAIACAV